MRRRLELKQFFPHVLIDLHQTGQVSTAIAVVGRGKDGDYMPLMGPIEPIHAKLVCPGDEIEVISVAKLLGNVLPEGIASASARVNAPAAAIVGV